ncbi:unnamed protein product, partial [Thelazia callipaeda]|uniref:SRCR domain-containing protein n=1 Tax=Thelazia callipaeda TaxID=103827 RepID=A0A0N5CR55_THECL
MLKMDIKSHSLREKVLAWIGYNYFTQNQFLHHEEDYVDNWPRSFAIGIFGAQVADVHFNRLWNTLFDFELISGVKFAEIKNAMNVTYNWWGSANEATISQRIFDFDDWNSIILAMFSPFYVTEENFISYWWRPDNGQIGTEKPSELSIYDLTGRMHQSTRLVLNRERWHEFPFYQKPFRPYRIRKDLTIMPGATLTIEKGVEIHVWPNVRILVLGNLKAEGTYWEPIRFKPINVTEYMEQRGDSNSLITNNNISVECMNGSDALCRLKVKRQANWAGQDAIYHQFPSLNRNDPYYQSFEVRLNSTVPKVGFLEFFNITTGQWIPSCDREFTLRNAQVVCRELGFGDRNVYEWLTPRWDYNPKINILKTYVMPRQCSGTESRLDQCAVRLTDNLNKWQCVDSEHFNFIHCGEQTILNNNYIGNWGGITIGHDTVDYGLITTNTEESILRNVEIVGAGLVHNETTDVAALLTVRRNPVFDHVNITNSSMHGLQILCPHGDVIINKLNVTHNRGRGLSFWLSNSQGTRGTSTVVHGDMNIIPYNAPGLLDICAAQKYFKLKNRIIIYYKYDSNSVDCVKIVSSSKQNIAFRFLLVNLYDNSGNKFGRLDSITLYNDLQFTQIIHRFTSQTTDWSVNIQAESLLAIHVSANAANGVYGFIAEIAITPKSTQTKLVDEVLIRHSRIDKNDRGAITYRNTGDIGPNLAIINCRIQKNGYHLYGNISTANHAVRLHFHNTMIAHLRNNLLMHNNGGLEMTALTTSPIARLTVVIRECAFMHNSNGAVLAFLGNGNQKLWMFNNIIRNNYASYHDTILLKGINGNLTHNLIVNNTGLHNLDLQANLPTSADSYYLYKNWFYDNIAFGHGYQYQEQYGYQPDHLRNLFKSKFKRDILIKKGVSFDWWSHVGMDSIRYPSTIFTGISSGMYRGNVFNNPKNSYELVTGKAISMEGRAVDAVENYWGYPGTVSVASGKIRDYHDYEYLIRVDYTPVIESNTSLIEGDCPAGWFQLGTDEFKSCFIYI